MTFCKAIKASKLKVDAVRLELLNGMRKFGRRVVREDLNATVATWQDKPQFDFTISLKQPGPTVVFIFKEDNHAAQVWRMLDVGTKPHEIWAGAYTGKSEHTMLAFPSMFQPKTEPRKLASRPGSSGGPTVFVPYVEHPGTEAREWTRTLGQKEASKYKREMEQAMIAGAKKSGHYMGR